MKLADDYHAAAGDGGGKNVEDAGGDDVEN